MSARKLRAVAPDEKPAPRVSKSVADAAAGGDRLELAVAMRDRVAKAISDPDCPPRDLASLTRRLDDLADKIVALEAAAAREAVGRVNSDVDETFDSSAL